MKTHYYVGSSPEDIERAPCGVLLGRGSGLSGDWGQVDCIRCQSQKKKKINESAAAEERAIVEQMGDMAAFMREEGSRGGHS